MTKLLGNIVTGLVIAASIATGGTATYKLLNAATTHAPGAGAIATAEASAAGQHDDGVANEEDISNRDNAGAETKRKSANEKPAGTLIVAAAKNTETPTNDNAAQTNANMRTSAAVSTTVFNAATLAAHNQPGNCYIAINGTVYDVSNSPAWANCRHTNGAVGGKDYSASFPHPASYLTGLPAVGTYSATNAATNADTTNAQTSATNAGAQNQASAGNGETARWREDDDENDWDY